MPYPPQSFATTTNIAIDVTAVDLSTLQVSSLISSVAATANAAAASTDTVVVEVVQTSTVAMPLPAGKTAAEVASAMTTTMCAGQAGCYVVVASRRRRQLQTGSGIFTVSRRLDSSTTGNLSAPTVPTAALATAQWLKRAEGRNQTKATKTKGRKTGQTRKFVVCSSHA